jgi:hypothetical protein
LPAVTLPSPLKAGRSLARLSRLVSRADVLVGIEGLRLALDLDLHRHDLALEAALVDGAGGALLALQRELVLVLAADAPALGDVLRRDAHVAAVEGIAEGADHGVDDLAVAEALAEDACPGSQYCARLMHSAPPATAASASPCSTSWAAETIACRPLPHRRLTVRAGVSTGRPPFTAATRAMYMSRGSVWMTLPNTQWPMSPGSSPARADRLAHAQGGQVGRRRAGEGAPVGADGRADGGHDDDFALLFTHGAGYPSIIHAGFVNRSSCHPGAVTASANEAACRATAPGRCRGVPERKRAGRCRPARDSSLWLRPPSCAPASAQPPGRQHGLAEDGLGLLDALLIQVASVACISVGGGREPWARFWARAAYCLGQLGLALEVLARAGRRDSSFSWSTARSMASPSNSACIWMPFSKVSKPNSASSGQRGGGLLGLGVEILEIRSSWRDPLGLILNCGTASAISGTKPSRKFFAMQNKSKYLSQRRREYRENN